MKHNMNVAGFLQLKNFITLLVLVNGITGCSSDGKKDASMQTSQVTETQEFLAFQKYEDSLGIIKNTKYSVSKKDANSYANRCQELAQKYPNNKNAPFLLDKAHMIFSNLGSHRSSVMVAELLVKRYASYKNRPVVIESIASTYDVFLKPREKSKVKEYYSFLLSEYPNIDSLKRLEIEDRLKNIDLTIEEMILSKTIK
jgi:hypothetical protein